MESTEAAFSKPSTPNPSTPKQKTMHTQASQHIKIPNNTKRITKLTEGKSGFLRALREANQHGHLGLIFYKHGEGFGSSLRTAYGTDWCSLTQAADCFRYALVRRAILAELNAETPKNHTDGVTPLR